MYRTWSVITLVSDSGGEMDRGGGTGHRSTGVPSFVSGSTVIEESESHDVTDKRLRTFFNGVRKTSQNINQKPSSIPNHGQ